MGTLHLAPLFRIDVQEKQNTFLTQHIDVGPDRLVLNEDCDVVTAINCNLIRIGDGLDTKLEISNCKKFY
ncbi:hypothetical protein GcM3_021026 [Golovinomyces cichoracearum]|uniref:Uncharacterized protein n=1 Tax=Golovinomyces cichoracearum TaxID=62708 RepID=A0A420J7K3_9PEZI|nr:hypothetical protein GcM3_021026 [Golovinomyces cichoracearum]